MGNIPTALQYWADQGAAPPGGAAAVRAPLESAQAEVLEAHAKVTAGDIVGAKTDVDQAPRLLRATSLVGGGAGVCRGWPGVATTTMLAIPMRRTTSGDTSRLPRPRRNPWAPIGLSTSLAAGGASRRRRRPASSRVGATGVLPRPASIPRRAPRTPAFRLI